MAEVTEVQPIDTKEELAKKLEKLKLDKEIGLLAELLKSGTDVTVMQDQFDDLREAVNKLTEGCSGATTRDIHIWNNLCSNISRLMPRFVASNKRKEAWEQGIGHLPEDAQQHIERVNRAIHAVFVVPLKHVTHYLFIAYMRTIYRDQYDLEFKKAETGVSAVAELLGKQRGLLGLGGGSVPT